MNVAQGQIIRTFQPCRPSSAENDRIQMRRCRLYTGGCGPDLFDPVLRSLLNKFPICYQSRSNEPGADGLRQAHRRGMATEQHSVGSRRTTTETMQCRGSIFLEVDIEDTSKELPWSGGGRGHLAVSGRPVLRGCRARDGRER